MNPKSHNLPYWEKFQPYARFLKEQNLFAKFTNNATIQTINSLDGEAFLKLYFEYMPQKDYAITLVDWNLADDPNHEFRTLLDKWKSFAIQCPFTKYDSEKEEWYMYMPRKYKRLEQKWGAQGHNIHH